MKQISLELFCVIMVVPFMAVGYLAIDSPNYYFIGFMLFGLICLLLALGARKGLIKPNGYYKDSKNLSNIGIFGVGLSLVCSFLIYALPDYEQTLFRITPLVYAIVLSLNALINQRNRAREN